MEQKDYDSFKNEVASLADLEHPHIMTFHHFYEDTKRFMMVTELCNGGELYDYLQDPKYGKMNELEAATCIK